MEEKYFKKSGGLNSDLPRAQKHFINEQQNNSEMSNEIGGGNQMMSMGKSIAMAQRQTNYTDGPQIDKRKNNDLISN